MLVTNFLWLERLDQAAAPAAAVLYLYADSVIEQMKLGSADVISADWRQTCS